MCLSCFLYAESIIDSLQPLKQHLCMNMYVCQTHQFYLTLWMLNNGPVLASNPHPLFRRSQVMLHVNNRKMQSLKKYLKPKQNRIKSRDEIFYIQPQNWIHFFYYYFFGCGHCVCDACNMCQRIWSDGRRMLGLGSLCYITFSLLQSSVNMYNMYISIGERSGLQARQSSTYTQHRDNFL